MIRDNLRLSLRQLWAHKLRAFLTVLSITIGVASIVAMTSLAQSGLATLTAGIEEMGGTRFIWIIPDAPKAGKAHAGNFQGLLTQGDRDALARALPHLETIVASKRFYDSTLRAGEASSQVKTMLATEPGYFSAYRVALTAGRPLTEADAAARRRVILIGSDLAKKLYGDANPVGRELSFRDERFEVIGVIDGAQKSGVHLGYEWGDFAIIPLTAPGVGSEVEDISLTLDSAEVSERVIRTAHAILMHRHNGVDNYQFLDFGGLLKNFYQAFAIMRLVVGLVAGVALLIGGIGVMNIMLVSVNERMREIGLRKALGAPKGVILGQFLTEAIVLSLFGAALGVALGLGLATGASAIIHLLNKAWVGTLSFDAIGLAVAAAGAIGLFFGWYPAKRAAELDPILCLRHE